MYVALDHGAAAKAIVPVDQGARPVVQQVCADVVQAALRLKPGAALLLVVTDLVHNVLHKRHATWLLAGRSVPPIDRRAVARIAPARPAPSSHAARTQKAELVALDPRAAVPPSQEDRGAVKPLELAVLEGQPDGAFRNHGSLVRERPISARRNAVTREKGVRGAGESQPAED